MLMSCVELLRWKEAIKATLLEILVRYLKESRVPCCEEGLAVLTDSKGSFPGAARAVPWYGEAGAGVQLWEPEEQHLELCVMIPSVLFRGLCGQLQRCQLLCYKIQSGFYGVATMGILFTMWPLLKFIIPIAVCQLSLSCLCGCSQRF